MKSIYSFLFLGLAISLSSCKKEDKVKTTKTDVINLIKTDPSNEQIIPGKYIVVFKSGTVPSALFKKSMTYEQCNLLVENVAADILRDNHIEKVQMDQVYNSAISGFAGSLTDQDFAKLKLDSRIEFIEQDRIVILSKEEEGDVDTYGKNTGGGTTQPAQITPAGITRVGGPGSAGTRKGWIIDTGIDFTHPDLVVNTTLSKSFVTKVRTAKDDNGHGSHVAGIIGAKNNTIGSVGVAAGVTLVAVKVIDKYGSGTISAIVAGIDYVASAAASGDVANISLGASSSASIDSAVAKAARKGILFAIAAGNSAADANNISPARLNGNGIFTASAMDANDNWASFSNYANPPIDYCEPGVNIFSCWLGGAYNTLSGTSMACPHLAGVLLVTNGSPATSGYVTNDPDGTADPIGHL